MILGIIYIGISQSIFAAILMFIKTPLKIADKILGWWLISISMMFILNLVKYNLNIQNDIWPVSIIISITFPAFLFLYTKYIMNDSQRFHYKDLIHFFPVIVVIILVFFHYDPKISSITSFVNFYSEKIMLRSIIGILFLFYLWIYSFITLIMLVKYQKTKRNFYSFDSKKINLFWLIFVVVSFFFIYNFNIFISAKNMAKPLDEEVEIFRSGALLVYVYFINICGLKQRQLDINEPSVSIKHPITTKKDTSSKYSKSSLNDQLASTYTDKLIKFMNTSKAWKDSELSVAKLSEETEIPKHHITQVLNEHLNKNFYTFVNEYRTEYAMKLIQSPEYKNWSFLAIAYESGFNSKTAFNSFFKKYTNNTPSDFKAHKTISKQNKSKN